MPSFLPSEIGRLIYGYLLTECNEDLAEEFLNSCDSLKECRMQRQLGRKFHATVQDLSLTGILNQYSVLSSIIFENATEGDRAHRNLLNLLQGLLKSRLGAVVSYYESKSICNTSTTSIVQETPHIPNSVARQTTEVGVQCSDVVTDSCQKRPNSSCDASVQCFNTSLNSLEKPFDSGYCDASILTEIADISHVESTVPLPIANDSLLLTSNSILGSDDNVLKSSHHLLSRVREQSDAENVRLVNDPGTAGNLPQLNNRSPVKSSDRLNDSDITENMSQLNESLTVGTISMSHVNPLPDGNVPQSNDHSQPVAESCGSSLIATEAPYDVGDTAIDVNPRVPAFDANLIIKPFNRTPMKVREPFTGSENVIITPSEKSRLVVNLRRTPLKVVEPNATSAKKKTGNREAHKSPVFDNYHIIGPSYRTPAKTRPKLPPETELLKNRTPDLARVQRSAEKAQRLVEKSPSDVPWDFNLRQSLAEDALKAEAEAKSALKCKKNRTPAKKRKADEASVALLKKSKPEEPVAVSTETDSKSAKSEAAEKVSDSSKLRSHRKNNITIDGAKPTEMCKKRVPKHIRKPDDASKAIDVKNEKKRNEPKLKNDVPKVRDVEDDTSQKSIDATIDDVIRGETDGTAKTVLAVNDTECRVLDGGKHETSGNSARNNSNKRSKHEIKVSEHHEKRKENRSESVCELPKSSSQSHKDVLCSTNSECQSPPSGSAVCHKYDASVASAANQVTKNTDALNGLECGINEDNYNWQSNLVKTQEFLLFHRDGR